jgi:hypothetical protein
LSAFLNELNKFKDVRTVLSRVASDEVASKPATSSIALLESIMYNTKQSIMHEMRKKQQQNLMGASTASNLSNYSNVPTQDTNSNYSFNADIRGKNNNTNSNSNTNSSSKIKKINSNSQLQEQ